MATLVLTTVGTAVGGPIGGALGALIGGQIDRRLLAPKGRQGARLADLKLQSSTYGAPIPKLFGTLRVAGTVIWSTDLIEEKARSGGGKSGPKTTSYSYSASFAVALSARPIRAVHRIWADGNLLRGAGGDWKTQTGFRLYLGGEDQAADPLIASAEGIADCPAYRGTAYAVFEGMALADYGNRIPSLTFEVEADDVAVPIGAIAAALGGPGVTGDAGPALRGYAASGSSVRGALEALADACPLSLTDDGTRLRVDAAPAGAIALPADGLGASADGKGQPALAIDRAAATSLPDAVEIAYYEPARDYQAGLQRARRGGAAVATRSIELAAALDAGEAKGLAEAALERALAERVRATVRLPWRWMTIGPGAHVRIAGEAGVWRVARAGLERMVAELSLVRVGGATGPAPAAAAGRSRAAADAAAGATLLELLDLPPGDEPATALTLWAAAAGEGAGWRRAALSLTLDGGASWSAIGDTAAPATIGRTVTALAGGDPALFDLAGSVLVDLAHDGMALTGASDAALIDGANAAMLGEELIQFGAAEQIAPRRWRLSRLLRGRRGTERAVAGHGPDERFVPIEPAALLPIALPPAALDRVVTVAARGLGDAEAVATTARAGGRALRPPAPVALRASAAGTTIRIAWTRRSRTGWAWIDAIDAPLGEEGERYRIAILVGGAEVRAAETAVPRFDYGAAERSADGAAAAGSFTVAVRQIGSLAPSDPAATADFSIEEIIP